MTDEAQHTAPLPDPHKRPPLRLRGRKKVMSCAFCGRQRPWPEWFVSRTYAECWACWLRSHPEHVVPMSEAIQEVTSAR